MADEAEGAAEFNSPLASPLLVLSAPPVEVVLAIWHHSHANCGDWLWGWYCQAPVVEEPATASPTRSLASSRRVSPRKPAQAKNRCGETKLVCSLHSVV